jgi:hypothetical protein
MIIASADLRLSSDTKKVSDSDSASRRDDKSDQHNAAMGTLKTPNQSENAAFIQVPKRCQVFDESVGIGCEFDKAEAIFILSKREQEVSKSERDEV